MQRVGFIIFPGFQILGLSTVTAFELANSMADEPQYEMRILSETGGLVTSSTGIPVATEAFGVSSFDTLLLCATQDLGPSSPGLLDFLRDASAHTRRIAATCSGAFALAEAGLLDGRRATTHWNYAREFQSRFPQVKVEEDRIFICDGPVWTSAGMTAGIDLALALVERDLGEDIARLVAKKLVVYHRRAGGQSQHSALLELEPKSDRIQKVLIYAKDNLHTPLSVEQLADVARLSPRQFSRAFTEETGQSPAKAVENLRLEAARLLIEQGRLSIDVVAQETGFGDRDRMRRAFLRAFGQPPQVIRRSSRLGEAA